MQRLLSILISKMTLRVWVSALHKWHQICVLFVFILREQLVCVCVSDRPSLSNEHCARTGAEEQRVVGHEEMADIVEVMEFARKRCVLLFVIKF